MLGPFTISEMNGECAAHMLLEKVQRLEKENAELRKEVDLLNEKLEKSTADFMTQQFKDANVSSEDIANLCVIANSIKRITIVRSQQEND